MAGNHVYGLSGSGLDVDNLVKQAMKAQQARYDSLYKKKTQLEWKKTDYNDFYKAINDFRSNTVLNYKMDSTLSPKKASSSNSAIADITASADAASVNHSLIVKNLAEGVSLTSSSTITTGAAKTTLATQFAGLGTDSFTIKLTNGTNTKEITVDPTKSIYEFVSSINDAGVNLKATYDTNLDRVFLYTTNTGAKTSIDFSGSSSKGLDFINKNLKLDTSLSGVSSVTSTASVGLNGVTAPLASQFANLTTPFTLQLHDVENNVDQTINIDPSTDSLSTMMLKINGTASPSAKAAVSYDPASGKVTIVSKVASNLTISSSDSNLLSDLGLSGAGVTSINVPPSGATSSANIGLDPLKDTVAHQLGVNATTYIQVNGKPLTIYATDTVNQLMDKLNGAMDTTATASYDAATGKFKISAASGNLDLSNYDSSALSFLSGTMKLPVLKQNVGQDAEIKLDGVTFNESSNIFTIAGLTYTLKGETDTPINVSVTNDVDKLVDNVKSFVDSYNKMLDKLNTEIDEKTYRDYLPLTTAEKAEMKETEITLWEQKAKSGLLHNDSALQELAYSMRNEMATRVGGISGDYNSAASIGITTGSYTEKGKLYLNETKLRKALEADPDAVQKIFGAKSDNVSEQGIAVRMYDVLKTASDKIVTTAGSTASTDYDTQSTLAKEIKDYDTRMYDMSKKLKDLQDSYYKKFDAMETALASLNKQSSWLSQQFGSGS